MAPVVVVTTTSGAINDDKVVVIATLASQFNHITLINLFRLREKSGGPHGGHYTNFVDTMATILLPQMTAMLAYPVTMNVNKGHVTLVAVTGTINVAATHLVLKCCNHNHR